MPNSRYSVYQIPYNDNLKDVNSKKELMLYLKEYTFELLSFHDDDRFRYYDEANEYAIDSYPKDSSRTVIAIYDRLHKNWIDGWFL